MLKPLHDYVVLEKVKEEEKTFLQQKKQKMNQVTVL